MILFIYDCNKYLPVILRQKSNYKLYGIIYAREACENILYQLNILEYLTDNFIDM